MNRLTVLYDARCGLCRLARQWVEGQPKYLDVEFLQAEGPEAHRSFPTLAAAGVPEELVVVDDEGGVYRGGSAWVMVLYALEDYREWSLRLGSPRLLPLARHVFNALSQHRGRLSRWLHLDADDDAIAQAVEPVPAETCEVAPHAAPPGAVPTGRLHRLPQRGGMYRDMF